MEIIPGKNGGYLTPGNPGNKGGGRTKDRIRAMAAEAGSKAVKKIADLLESGEQLSPSDLRGCCDILLKYGIGTKTETELKVMDDELLDKCCAWVAERYDKDAASDLYEFMKGDLAEQSKDS